MSLFDPESVENSPTGNSVAHVERDKTLRDAVLASLRPSGHHLRDDEIFEIVTAGSDREAAEQLFAAKGITFPMYCVWRSKYRHLSLDELRAARRRQLWRARGVFGVVVMAGVLGATGVGFGVMSIVKAKFTRATHAPPVVSVRPMTPSAPAPSRDAGNRQESAAPVAPEAQRTTPLQSPSLAIAPGDRAPSEAAPAEPGYKIQVAAAQTLQEGRALVVQLTSAGRCAYMLRATVGNVDVFRVRVGPFDTLESAAEIASQLRRDGFNGAWIAR